MHAVSVGPRIDRVTQDPQDAIGRRRSPFQLADASRALRPKPQLQLVRDEVAKDRVGRSEFLELVEDQLDHAPCLLVWFLDDLSGGHLEVADGNVQEQLATLRFVAAAAQQAIPQRHQFIFAHGASHAQEKPIVAVQGIVDAILIAEQGVEDATHVDELMPVLVGSRQPAEFQPQAPCPT